MSGNMLMAWGGAVVACFAVAIFISAFITQGFIETMGPGALAGWFVYKHFKKKDQDDLNVLLNPPAEVWPVSLPVAWGSIKDVLDGSKVQTGVSGTSTWRIEKEDDSRGIISANLNFSEMVGGATSGQVLPRSVGLTALLQPDGAQTKVEVSYHIFSPMKSDQVRKIVDDTHAAFKRAAEANKGS